ncbi:LOW QUALITY PROTEIN: NACHT, LRR and PYD domains-containing protein 3-like [Sardina pilchardus]|uniref:LOW QUALITY PROTEIN: NACHT, LRR and PYD domains-containing protein 3-like n=1 Tax=Sardina pilchardus TaxID=27697 RepID=UPI002E130539
MKSDESMAYPTNLSSDPTPGPPHTHRPPSPVPSCVSMKSDESMDYPTNFSSDPTPGLKPPSPVPSCVSMKSDESMDYPTNFSSDPTPGPKPHTHRPPSPVPSCVSMKSDESMDYPTNFSSDPTPGPKPHTHRPPSPVPSCVSMNSDESMDYPTNFSSDPTPGPKPHTHRPPSPVPSCVSMKSDESMAYPTNFSSDPTSGLKCVLHTHTVSSSPTGLTRDLKQTLDQEMDDAMKLVKEKYKSSMKNKYESLFEGNKIQDKKTSLNRIYTQLYIIEGESEGVNTEHEVLQMEKTQRIQRLRDTPINCNEIFAPLLQMHKGGGRVKIRMVLTKGIAGIGKTVFVHKFILDWAEGKSNQDVDFIFMFPFRELNLVKDDEYSLHRLLLDFHPELRGLDTNMYDKCKLLFIFDGLDESRIPLEFSGCQKMSTVTMTSSVGALMSNLIKGELLPSAVIWLTSRPAASTQIPSQYIKRVTEVQGFSDPQKVEYFKKRISDEHQADRVISHITKAKSLHIMCHIPVFCWISATVLQKMFEQDDVEIPRTLTEMYTYFLLVQMSTKSQKYDERDEKDPKELLQSNREVLLKLAKLAFKQLMEGNIMFYDQDLKECGIDVNEASVYAGICTEIFKEESVFHQRKVYSFIHLSFQEFLAAVHVFHFYVVMNTEALQHFSLLYSLLRSAVDEALKSGNGHLDLFLRLLLGISLESNQRLLQGLLTHTESSSESIKEITQYIKHIIRSGLGSSQHLSPGRSINLFLCLLEVKDQSLYKEIQEFLKSETLTENELSPTHCSAIAYMLQMSEEVLDELNLKKYNTSVEGGIRLLPAVRNCRRALCMGSYLTAQSCEIVASALQLQNSPLRELDMSNNDLQDSGVKLLTAGLKNPHCKLEILRLSGCLVTAKGCSYLASALNSNPSHLKELDLTYNHSGESGEKMLSALLKDPDCKLETLKLDFGGQCRIIPGIQKYACELSLDPNTANAFLSLSEGNRKVTRLEEKQPYPDHPDRFDFYEQVLCREGLSGRSYWEAEWDGVAAVAVAYKGISRKGKGPTPTFGHNKNSWRLYCGDSKFSVWHDGKSTDVQAPSPCSNRVGVYLDWPAGTLSFYSVSSETHILKHLHTCNCTFTEPLYAGFRPYSGSVTLHNINSKHRTEKTTEHVE